MHAENVALLHRDVIVSHDFGEHFVSNGRARIAVVVTQIDHHRAALHAGLRHFRHRHRACAELAVQAAILRIDNAPAVVRHRFFNTIAVGIEHRALVREAVPVRGVLHVEHDCFVGADVVKPRIDFRRRQIEIRFFASKHRMKHRRFAIRIQHRAARFIQRMRQREHLPGLHLLQRRKPALGSDVVHAPVLIVVAEFAPVGAFGAVFPSFVH